MTDIFLFPQLDTNPADIRLRNTTAIYRVVMATGLNVPVSTGAPITAVSFDAAADRLQSTAVPASPANVTATFWFRPKAAGLIGNNILFEFDQGGGWDVLLLVGGVLQHLTGGFGLVSQPTGVSVNADQWYFAAISINGTAAKSYQGDESTAVVNASGTTSTGSTFKTSVGGSNGFPSMFPTVDMALVRIWDAVLSPTEVEAERTSRVPVRTANLAADWRLPNDAGKLTDSSGLGNNLATTGAGPWQDTSGPAIGSSGAVVTTSAAIDSTSNGLAVPVSFGAATVTQPGAGTQTVAANGLAVPVSTGSATVSATAGVTATGLAVPVSPGSATVAALNAVGATGLAVPVSTGSASVAASNTLGATGLAVPVSPGSATVSAQNAISATGLAVPVSPGSATVSASNTIGATGLAVPASYGSATVATTATISATGLAVPVSTGSATVSQPGAGTQTVTTTGLAVPVSTGSAAVSASNTIGATGLAVTVSTGLASISTGPVAITAQGLAVPINVTPATVLNSNTIAATGLAVPVGAGLASITNVAGAPQTINASGYLVTITFGKSMPVYFFPVHARRFGNFRATGVRGGGRFGR